MSVQNTELLADKGKDVAMYTNDGVYKVRVGAHCEKLIQMKAELIGEWRRFTSEDKKRVVFERV